MSLILKTLLLLSFTGQRFLLNSDESHSDSLASSSCRTRSAVPCGSLHPSLSRSLIVSKVLFIVFRARCSIIRKPPHLFLICLVTAPLTLRPWIQTCHPEPDPNSHQSFLCTQPGSSESLYASVASASTSKIACSCLSHCDRGLDRLAP